MKLNKYIFTCIIFLIILIGLELKIYAGSFSLSASSYNVEPGEKITIYVTGNGVTGAISLSGSNIDIEYNGDPWVDNDSYTATGTVGSSGSATITATANDLIDFDTEEEISGSKSISITISEPESETDQSEEYDGNDYEGTENAVVISNPVEESKPTPTPTPTSTPKETPEATEEPKEETKIEPLALTSLKINGYTLYPNFSKDIKQYTIKVTDIDVFKLDVEAKANREDSSIVISGNENIKLGDNELIVSVKSDDDKENVEYKIKAIKEITTYKEELDEANKEISNLKNQISQENKKVSLYKNIIITMSVVIILLIGFIVFMIIKKRKNHF